eukprot:6232655-Amphidinium_carterae.2
MRDNGLVCSRLAMCTLVLRGKVFIRHHSEKERSWSDFSPVLSACAMMLQVERFTQWVKATFGGDLELEICIEVCGLLQKLWVSLAILGCRRKRVAHDRIIQGTRSALSPPLQGSVLGSS